jgi:hypothetical protein
MGYPANPLYGLWRLRNGIGVAKWPKHPSINPEPNGGGLVAFTDLDRPIETFRDPFEYIVTPELHLIF